jgi:hypothetical protein
MGSNSGEKTPELPFYAPLGNSLSQGDIVRGVPWGVITDPVTLCRIQGGPHRATVDNIAEVPSAFKKGQEYILARAELSLGIVLWPDCQIDKFKEQRRPEDRWFASIAPVLPMDPRLPELQRQSVREQRRRAYFYVPANEPLGIPESYVDVRHIWPVKQSALKDRLATLSVDARAALYHHLFVFMTYLRPKESARCSACGAALSLADALEIIQDDPPGNPTGA